MKSLLAFTFYLVIALGVITCFSSLGNVNPYSFPSAVQALKIIKYNEIPTPQSETAYWKTTLVNEIEYPIPSILLAMYYLVTNISPSFLPFLPITGFVLLIFYLITLKALLEINRITDLIKEKPFFAFLSLAITLLDLFIRNDAHYVGRATLGVTLLVITSYIFLIFMSGRDVDRRFLLLLITIVVIAYTYYTSFLATFMIVILYTLFIYAFKFSNSNISKRGYTLTLAVTLLFLTITRPFVALVRTTSLSPEKFIENLMDWVLSKLRIERGEAIEFFGEVPIDLFTRVSTVWLGYAIRLFSIFTFAFYLINRIAKSKTISRKASHILKPGDIYAIIVIGATIAELLYTFLIPIVSLRYITMFSAFYVPLMLIRIKNSRIGNVIAIFITLLLILFYIGTCRSVFIYGKVGTAKYISGISSYISFNEVALSKTIITGDSYYTGYLWFMHTYNTILNNSPHSVYERVSFTILDKDIYDLFGSHNINRTVYCIKKLVAGGISTLIIINDGKPVRGTAWGYMTLLSPTTMKFLINNSNIMYNDINSLLLELTSST
jgi:hypothetical protein